MKYFNWHIKPADTSTHICDCSCHLVFGKPDILTPCCKCSKCPVCEKQIKNTDHRVHVLVCKVKNFFLQVKKK